MSVSQLRPHVAVGFDQTPSEQSALSEPVDEGVYPGPHTAEQLVPEFVTAPAELGHVPYCIPVLMTTAPAHGLGTQEPVIAAQAPFVQVASRDPEAWYPLWQETEQLDPAG